METKYFPGNKVINLFPHWANADSRILINRKRVGIIDTVDNNLVTVLWTLDTDTNQDYATSTIPKTHIQLAA